MNQGSALSEAQIKRFVVDFIELNLRKFVLNEMEKDFKDGSIYHMSVIQSELLTLDKKLGIIKKAPPEVKQYLDKSLQSLMNDLPYEFFYKAVDSYAKLLQLRSKQSDEFLHVIAGFRLSELAGETEESQSNFFSQISSDKYIRSIANKLYEKSFIKT